MSDWRFNEAAAILLTVGAVGLVVALCIFWWAAAAHVRNLRAGWRHRRWLQSQYRAVLDGKADGGVARMAGLSYREWNVQHEDVKAQLRRRFADNQHH